MPPYMVLLQNFKKGYSVVKWNPSAPPKWRQGGRARAASSVVKDSKHLAGQRSPPSLAAFYNSALTTELPKTSKWNEAH